jgi:hypothetical protein
MTPGITLCTDGEWEISVTKCDVTVGDWEDSFEGDICPGYRWSITHCQYGCILETCDFGEERRLWSSMDGPNTIISDVTGYTREEFLDLACG